MQRCVGSPLNTETVKEIIEKYKSRDAFLRLVSVEFGLNTEQYRLVVDAETMISEGFVDIRRHTGEEYVEHQRSVAVIGLVYCGEKDHISVLSDLLHDSVEDTEATPSLLRRKFGRTVANTVVGQTKPAFPEQGDMSVADHKELCSRLTFEHLQRYGARSMRGKCRDRLHNMLTLWGTPLKKLDKIRETLEFMMPISIHVDYLWQELTMATAEQLERLSVDDTEGLLSRR